MKRLAISLLLPIAVTVAVLWFMLPWEYLGSEAYSACQAHGQGDPSLCVGMPYFEYGLTKILLVGVWGAWLVWTVLSIMQRPDVAGRSNADMMER